MPHILVEYLCSDCEKPVSFMISNTLLVIEGAQCRDCGKEQLAVKNPIPLLSEGALFLYCTECGAKYKEAKPGSVTTIKLGKLGGKYQMK